jgi:hypothetical protein
MDKNISHPLVPFNFLAVSPLITFSFLIPSIIFYSVGIPNSNPEKIMLQISKVLTFFMLPISSSRGSIWWTLASFHLLKRLEYPKIKNSYFYGYLTLTRAIGFTFSFSKIDNNQFFSI